MVISSRIATGVFISGVFGWLEDNLGVRPLPGIWTLEHFLYLCRAKEFYACISHPMMGVAITGTGAQGFFSFFIFPLHTSAK